MKYPAVNAIAAKGFPNNKLAPAATSVEVHTGSVPADKYES